MKPIHTFLIVVQLLCTCNFFAQVHVKLIRLPENTSSSARIYIAGNFNGWNPENENFELKKDENNFYTIRFNTDLKEIEFKFTLGSWEKEECSLNGSAIPNRKSIVNGNDSIFAEIIGWKEGEKKHTASRNVSILKEDFYIPQLDRKRRIWIYLPPDYYQSNKLYPVFYAHDGQNLFDAASSFSGEWGVDECLDSLFELNSNSSIIVGIENGGADRMEELTPWPNAKYGGGKAGLYADFIVKTLKPYIDSAYRTRSDKKNTGVFGSSLGGLTSHYMALKYPEIFGKVGVLSPSFWFSEEIYKMAESYSKKKSQKIYILAGRTEDADLEKEVLKMKQILERKKIKKNLKVEILPDGQHNEWFWRREFPKVYQWLNN